MLLLGPRRWRLPSLRRPARRRRSPAIAIRSSTASASATPTSRSAARPDPGRRQLRQERPSPTARVRPSDLTGDAAGTYNTDFTTGVLNQQVSFVLAEQEVAKRGIEVTDADIVRRRDRAGQRPDDRLRPPTPPARSPTTARRSVAHRPRPVPGHPGRGASPTSSPCEPPSPPTSPPTRPCGRRSTRPATRTASRGVCVSDILVLAGQGPTRTRPRAPSPDADSDFAAALAKTNGLIEASCTGAGRLRHARPSPAPTTRRRRVRRRRSRLHHPIGTYVQPQPRDRRRHRERSRSARSAEPVKTNYGYRHRPGPQPGVTSPSTRPSPSSTATVPAPARSAVQDWFVGAAKARRPSPSTRSTARGTPRPAPVVPPGRGRPPSTTAPTLDPSTGLRRRAQRRPAPPPPPRPSAVTGSVVPARIVVVGLGPAGPDLVTAGALAAHRRGRRGACLRTTRHPAASVVPDAGSVRPRLRARRPRSTTVYRQIVERRSWPRP